MTSAQRKHIQAIQAYLVAHTAKIGYLEHRPMATKNIKTMAELEKHVAQGFSMDCSESVTLICHVAGVKDPNGLHYNGNGNTQTLLGHLTHYTNAKAAHPGALVIFNSDRPLSEQHVAMVHARDEHHGNPVLFTHGTATDPSFHTLSWLQHGFSGRTVFLNVSHL